MTLTRSTIAPSFLAAALLHGVAIGWVALRPASRLRQPPRPPTTLRLVSHQRPTPPAEPKRAVERARARPDGAVAAAIPPAPPRPAPASASPPQPRRFAVSMDAVAAAGGIAMPTTAGATAALGDPTLPPSAPVGDNTPFARVAADVTEVDRVPRLLRQPSNLDLRALYPDAARREGIEGNVRLELLVSDGGAVADVRVLERAGSGFDEAAVALARRMTFSPAVRGGRPVAVRIPWTLKFRLDA